MHALYFQTLHTALLVTPLSIMLNPIPLHPIRWLIHLVGRQFGRLFILDFLRQDQIEHEVDERHDRETRLEHEDNGVVEAE